MTYRLEVWGMRVGEGQKLYAFEMKCLRSMVGVTSMDRERNEVIRRRTDIRTEIICRVDRYVLRRFGHIERMDDNSLIKRVMRESVSGTAMRGSARCGWMDGVKSTLSKEGVSVEAASVRARDINEWRDIVMQL